MGKESEYKNIGGKIRKLRKLKNFHTIKELISDKEWAALFSNDLPMLKTNTYGKYENDKRSLSLDRLRKISKYYEVSIEYFNTCTQDDNSLFDTVSSIASLWEKDHSYSIVKLFSERYANYIYEIILHDKDLFYRNKFLFLVSLYKGLGWGKFLKHQKDDKESLSCLLETIDSRYRRVFYRTIYCLQYYDFSLLEEFIDEGKISTADKKVLLKVVKNHTVLDYLYSISKSSKAGVKLKAQKVLNEINELKLSTVVQK